MRQGSGSGESALSPRWPTHRQDERNNHASSRVRLAQASVTFQSWSGGGRGLPGASEELLASSRSVGRSGCSHGHTGSSRKDPPLAGGATHPPPARQQSRACRRTVVGAQGAIAWPPRSRAGGPGGARAGRAERFPAESDAPAGAEAVAPLPSLGAPCPGTPRKHPLEKIFGVF